MTTAPAVYYFGHHKCGTNWMRGVLKDTARTLGMGYEVRGGRADDFEGEAGRGVFRLAVNPLAAWSPNTVAEPDLGFHLIRDPRDVLVSQYWSWKSSHQNNTPEIERVRAQLHQLPLADGLALMIEHHRMLTQLRGRSVGTNPRVRLVRYEDLWAKGDPAFTELFGFLQLPLDADQIEQIVRRNSFEAISGRKAGDEDTSKHLRRGSPGGWREVFTPELEAAFENAWPGEIERLGY